MMDAFFNLQIGIDDTPMCVPQHGLCQCSQHQPLNLWNHFVLASLILKSILDAHGNHGVSAHLRCTFLCFILLWWTLHINTTPSG